MAQQTQRGAGAVAPDPGVRSGAGAGSLAVPGQVPGGGRSLAEDLGALEALVDRLTAVDVADLDGPAAGEVLTVLTRATDRLSALRLRTLPPVEADGRWALDGVRTFAQWLAHHGNGSVAQTRRDVRLARALREDLPATADAVTDGQVSVAHARVLATVGATSDVRRQVLAGDSVCNEMFLLDQAKLLGVDQFRTLVRNWAAAADPDADDRGYRDAGDREFLEFSRTLGGFHLAGFLTDEHGHALSTALSAVTGVPAAGDQRTTAQRRAHALTDLARLTLDHGLSGTGASVRPHLSVHVTLDQLRALTNAGVDHSSTDHNGTARSGTGTGDGSTACGTHGVGPGGTDAAGVVTPLHTYGAAPAGAAGTAARDTIDGETTGGDTAGRDAGDADPDDRPDSDCHQRPPRSSGLPTPPWPGGPPPPQQPVPPRDAHPPRPGGEFTTPATFDDGTPVPATLLARLACDSEVTRIVFGPPGIVLDVGRAQRTVTGQLRRAVIARDRHCVYPECTAPPALSEVHHIRHWAHGGATSVENSILVCWHHHDLIHRTDITIDGSGGAWTFTDRHHQAIGRQTYPAAA